MKSWASIGKNNNIFLMVTSWWSCIKFVAPAAEITATLMHPCRGYGGGGGMDIVTDVDIVWFDIGQWFYIPQASLLFIVTSIPHCRRCNATSSSTWSLVIFVKISCRLLLDLLSSSTWFIFVFYLIYCCLCLYFLSSYTQFLVVFYAIVSSLSSRFLHCDCLVLYVVIALSSLSHFLRCNCLVFVVSFSTSRSSCLCHLVFYVVIVSSLFSYFPRCYLFF